MRKILQHNHFDTVAIAALSKKVYGGRTSLEVKVQKVSNACNGAPLLTGRQRYVCKS